MTGIKVYKYGNRKLYSPSQMKYVTLKEILEMTKNNIIFTVICHKTKNDITAEVLFAAVNKYAGPLPLGLLESIVHLEYNASESLAA